MPGEQNGGGASTMLSRHRRRQEQVEKGFRMAMRENSSTRDQWLRTRSCNERSPSSSSLMPKWILGPHRVCGSFAPLYRVRINIHAQEMNRAGAEVSARRSCGSDRAISYPKRA